MSEKPWLSNREWIFVIILVVLSQFLLHQYASNVKDETQVINYISFSGTIVSIILAVLAIIYSFFQSITQQGNSDKIASNLESLTNVASTVNKSVDTMTSQVESLNSVVSDVQRLPSEIVALVSIALEKLNREHVTDITTVMSEHVATILSIKDSDSLKNKADKHADDGEKEENGSYHDVHSSRWSIITTTIMSCVIVNKLNVVDVVYELVEYLEGDPQVLREITIMITGASSSIATLRDLGLVDEDKKEGFYFIKSNDDQGNMTSRLCSIIAVYYSSAITDIHEKFNDEGAAALIKALKLTPDSCNAEKLDIVKKLIVI
ncbi:hypothetical protein ACK3ZW_08055 [Aeromonas caviae]